MSEVGLPTRPIVMFWSGDFATLMRYKTLDNGKDRVIVLFIIPSEQMIWRYPEIEKALSYKYGGVSGFIIKQYPAQYAKFLSVNPELPVLLMLCNFDGTFTFDTELHSETDTTRRLEKEIKRILAENEGLRETAQQQAEELRQLKTAKE